MSNLLKNNKLIYALVLVVVLAIGFIFVTKSKTGENAATEQVQVDVGPVLSERILGDVSAPIRIEEFSSLTCSHCGQFHRETFEQFKQNYIDTGKAYLVFTDFPLNAAALHASAAARCVPQDRYFDYIGHLYAQQDSWASNENYMTFLTESATQFGGDPATVKACIESGDVRNGIADRMNAARQQWNISATPSFVINNKTLISGAFPYAEFAAEIEKAVNPEAAATATEDAAVTTEEGVSTEETPASVTEEGAESAPAAEEAATEETVPETTEPAVTEDPAAEKTINDVVEDAATEPATDASEAVEAPAHDAAQEAAPAPAPAETVEPAPAAPATEGGEAAATH